MRIFRRVFSKHFKNGVKVLVNECIIPPFTYFYLAHLTVENEESSLSSASGVVPPLSPIYETSEHSAVSSTTEVVVDKQCDNNNNNNNSLATTPVNRAHNELLNNGWYIFVMSNKYLSRKNCRP